MLPDGTNTFAGIIVAVLPSLLSAFGLHLVPGASDLLSQDVGIVITLLGGVYAAYGRLRATVPGLFAKSSPSA